MTFVLNRVIKMEGVILNRICVLRIFCPKQGQGFKPSATHLYPNISQAPTQGFLSLVTTVIAGPDRPRYCLNFSSFKLGSKTETTL